MKLSSRFFTILCATFFLGMSPKPVLIDTDMASDDWSAILYLLNHKDIKVVGIVVDGNGEAHCDLKSKNIVGANNALGLISLAGKEFENIPVACGYAESLQGNHVFPSAWREAMDNLLGLTLPFVPKEIEDGVSLIVSTLQNSPEKVDILALGPLTNLGRAFELYPSLVDNVGTITIMGGAVNVPGNLDDPGSEITNNPYAEWNIFIDPHSANLVFRSGAPIQLIPLDGTSSAPVTMEFFHRFGKIARSPSAQFVYDFLSNETDLIQTGKFYFWDTLSSVVLTNPDVCHFDEYSLSVNEAEGQESGRTQIDALGTTMKVCTSANRKKFEKLFVNTIN